MSLENNSPQRRKERRGIILREKISALSASLRLNKILSTLFLLLLLTGCASASPVVKIGLVAPFEGENRAVGYDVIYAARLAVREINEAGGIGGYRVALVALDDGGDLELARQTAVSLSLDPAVEAVLGHWQAETTAVAQPIYAQSNLAFIPMGDLPFGPADPAAYPPDFLEKYQAVSPFEETAGPYAGSTYDAFQLLWQALEESEQTYGRIDRETVAKSLDGLQ
jgi:ABC-type branched-subunit amino acid transport system substrate-binding protein